MLNFIEHYLYLNNAYINKSKDNSIYDLAVNKNQLFVPDYKNNKVIIYALPKKNVIQTVNVSMPHGIAINADGLVHICTYKNNSIFIFNKNFKGYKKNKMFDYPLSIAIKKNYIFIANWGKGDSGNIVFSNDNLNSYRQFTNKWLGSKPHAVRMNEENEILVVYRHSPGIVIYNINGEIIIQKVLNKNFDPVSIISYNGIYLVPNSNDGLIYLFDSQLNILESFHGGDYLPTNLAIWRELLLISEENANRILSVRLKNLKNIIKK